MVQAHTTDIPPCTGGTGGVGAASPTGESSGPQPYAPNCANAVSDVMEKVRELDRQLTNKYGKNYFKYNVLWKGQYFSVLHKYKDGEAELTVEYYTWSGYVYGYSLYFNFVNNTLKFVHWSTDLGMKEVFRVNMYSVALLELYKHFVGMEPAKLPETLTEWLPASYSELEEKLRELVDEWVEDIRTYVASLAAEEGEE